MEDSPVVIVGAGLAGCLSGLFMRRRGKSVVIVDLREDPRGADALVAANGASSHGLGLLANASRRSINLALSSRGLRALRKVGLANQVLDMAVPMHGRMIHAVDGATTLQPYGCTEDEVLYSVPRDRMNRCLLDELAKDPGPGEGPVALRFGCKCTAVAKDGTVTLGGANEKLRADLILGADGTFSATRRELGKLCRLSLRHEYIDHGYMELTILPTGAGRFAMNPNALHIWPRHNYGAALLRRRHGRRAIGLVVLLVLLVLDHVELALVAHLWRLVPGATSHRRRHGGRLGKAEGGLRGAVPPRGPPEPAGASRDCGAHVCAAGLAAPRESPQGLRAPSSRARATCGSRQARGASRCPPNGQARSRTETRHRRPAPSVRARRLPRSPFQRGGCVRATQIPPARGRGLCVPAASSWSRPEWVSRSEARAAQGRPAAPASAAQARGCGQGAMAMERNCTILLHYDKSAPPHEEELKEQLESKDVVSKRNALKSTIQLMLNGEVMPGLLMPIIRFGVPCEDHTFKKLFLIYLEAVDKTGADGKLLPEMILIWYARIAPPPPVRPAHGLSPPPPRAATTSARTSCTRTSTSAVPRSASCANSPRPSCSSPSCRR